MNTLTTLARHLNLAARRRSPRHYRGIRNRLPALWLVTDEARLADPRPVAAQLPQGAGILFRHYDDPARPALAHELWQIARRQHLLLIVALDENPVNDAMQAHGFHFPERLLSRPALHPVYANTSPRFLLTGAAHSSRALVSAARAQLDAVFISPVFSTQSHPNATPLGPTRFSGLVHKADLPVYALGGVNPHTAPQLRGSGAAGLAAIGALSK